MTFHRQTCDPRRLDLFFRDRLPGELQPDLEAHLLACPACRQRLDEWAGGVRWWADVRRYLGGDGASELLATSDQAGSRCIANVDLSFLKPSDNPASLGRLGTYEILEVLGQGGWGVVLKAFDAALHRPVAIKVLAAEYAAHGAARKRFAREAQAAAAVIHENVVPVYAIDADATPPYLVMAFIPGQSLQQRLDRWGPLELKEILRIGTQTASGLAAAHSQGLVHRDIKPANIMLENGIERVRITDFGLARAVDDASVTQSGAVAGTPQYMAPEQARGEAVDQRADLFSLGSTVYAMCTGQAPFRGGSGVAVLRQVSDVEPTPIRTLNPDVPVWLEGIVRRLHAKDPARRFQSTAEVADLLERCLAHVQQPDRHPLPPVANELGRQVADHARPGRYRRYWPASTALGICILCGAALLFLSRPLANRQQAPAEYPSPEPVQFDEEFRDESGQLRARLDSLGLSLWAVPPGGGLGPEPTLDQVRQRAEMLERDFNAAAEPSADPVEAQLESIRRRLELMQQRAGSGLK
jgi:serine/threonine-protein kinase